MKGLGTLTLFYVLFSTLFSYVNCGVCSEEDINSLSLVDNLNPCTEELNQLFKVMRIFGEVGKRLALTPGSQDISEYTRELSNRLKAHNIKSIKEECLNCFSENIKCTVKFCKTVCSTDICSKGCKMCHKSKCESQLINCIGNFKLADPCNHKADFNKYKLPEV